MAQQPGSSRSSPPPHLRSIRFGTPLPQPIAPFVGREEEIKSIGVMLADPEVRLLTLVGPGGVGKTRLALRAASGMAESLHHSMYFVSLAALTSPAGVLGEIANALNASDGGARPLIEAIRAVLRDLPTLIILDNVEHLLPEAAGIVSELIVTCASVNILATSRAPLRVYGERRFPVHPLPVTVTLTHEDHPSDRTDPDAVRLFVLRAQAVDPYLRLTGSNRNDIFEICRRLDGLPLAIELAAARAAELPPRAYLQRLVQSLPIPDGGPRDMPKRQQTMNAAVGWGYDLLEPDQQKMLRRMAVFAGEFDADAAEAMATDVSPDSTQHDEPTRSALDLLFGLVEASLVQRRTDASGEPRYQMLETIRRFGLDRADAGDERADLHRRHATYFLDQVVRANEHLLSGMRLVHWLGYLDDLLSNIRSAMDWCRQHDPVLLAQFTKHLMQYWLRRSRILEGISWLQRAREVESALSEVERGWVWANLARLCQYTRNGDVDSLYGEALNIARTYADHELELAVHIGQALHAVLNNQPEDAAAAFDAAMNIPDVQKIALGITQPTFLPAIEALVAAVSGDLHRAGALATQLLIRADHEEDDIAPGLLCRILGTVDRRHGELESGRAHVLRALETYNAVGEEWNIGNCLMDLSGYFQQDHPELSIRLAGAADHLFAIHGARRIDPEREPFRSLANELRRRLGEETVRTLWQEGAAQPWQIVLQDARTTPVDKDVDQPLRTMPILPQGIGGALSPRERDVLRMIAEGLTDREIAVELGLTYRTITTYVSNILTKLDVPSRTAAVSRAAREGFLDS